MPDSLITQFVNDAWDPISKAVTKGLGLAGQKTLSDVVTIVTEKVAPQKWQPAEYVPKGGGRSRVRESAESKSAAVFDYLHRFHLDYDTLQSPDLGGIEAWAASARTFELRDVVGRFAAAATHRDCAAAELGKLTAGGWGQLRCVTFTPPPRALAQTAGLASMNWDGPVSTGMPSPDASIQALLFRAGGGPYLRRPADLTLGWVPCAHDCVNLVLPEQLELVNVTATTITGIRIVK